MDQSTEVTVTDLATELRTSTNLCLTPMDNRRLADLCGQYDEHLRQIERHLGVEINNRGNEFHIIGPEMAVSRAKKILLSLYAATTSKAAITPAQVHLFIREAGVKDIPQQPKNYRDRISIQTRNSTITARNPNQESYLQNIITYDINFSVGPAGTGKTYLAVACAVDALQREQVNRILLVRPAVEAGEKLGFLPGDLAEKVNPYLRPLYDALYEMLGFDEVAKLIEKAVIEIAPLAFMRGRTLNDTFAILDEGQNTTPDQMKMFLTRLGFGSKAVITGDITQVDLPKGETSGLRHAIEALNSVENISFTFFNAEDTIRHPLIQRIVEAYARYEDGKLNR